MRMRPLKSIRHWMISFLNSDHFKVGWNQWPGEYRTVINVDEWDSDFLNRCQQKPCANEFWTKCLKLEKYWGRANGMLVACNFRSEWKGKNKLFIGLAYINLITSVLRIDFKAFFVGIDFKMFFFLIELSWTLRKKAAVGRSERCSKLSLCLFLTFPICSQQLSQPYSLVSYVSYLYCIIKPFHCARKDVSLWIKL